MILPSHITIDTVQPLYSSLKNDYEQINALNFKEVVSLDTAGLQLLLVFMMEKEKKGAPLNMLSMPSNIKDKFKLLGLWDHVQEKIGEDHE